MADKAIKYYREYDVQKKGGDVKFYDNIQDAIDDPNPQLKRFVYQANTKILGEIKLALIPIDDSNGQAVRAVLSVSNPVDPKST